MVYGDSPSDNPLFNGYFATIAADGLIVGRSDAFITTGLIHETGHAIDTNLASSVAGTAYSSSAAWHNAVIADGYAVTAYGAGSYVEDFADAGRVVLLNDIYPGGLSAFAPNNPNLTQIVNQLAAVRSAAGQYYVAYSTCDLTKKFPFPTNLVDV